ncbi:hypothetical protein ACFYZ9_33815 [Streptomyces sp. NPDC001691]|uniref:hypothetical protein n=1 Tax=Streptomyces sp. NPDC001691 TaxID=3364600 RepID=UPI0036D13B16
MTSSTIPQIDFDAERTAAADEITAQLANITDPRARLRSADEMREQALLEMATLRPERDELIANVALLNPHPALHKYFGISDIALRAIVAEALGEPRGRSRYPAALPEDPAKAAQDAGIRRIRNAAKKAVETAVAFEKAEARRAAALHHIGLARAALIGDRTNVGRLERPDFDAIRAAAADEVTKEFSLLAVGPVDRLLRAADIVNDAQAELDGLSIERDQCIASLMCYTTARGINISAGLQRTAVQRIMTKALGLPRDAKLPTREELPAAGRAADVPLIEDAHTRLPSIVREYERYRARKDTATPIRNAAILAVAEEPHGWTHEKIGPAIGRDPSLVSRIINGRR